MMTVDDPLLIKHGVLIAGRQHICETQGSWNHQWNPWKHKWLVVWNIFYFSRNIGNVIIPIDELPIDELIFFRWVGIPPSRYNHWMLMGRPSNTNGRFPTVRLQQCTTTVMQQLEQHLWHGWSWRDRGLLKLGTAETWWIFVKVTEGSWDQMVTITLMITLIYLPNLEMSDSSQMINVMPINNYWSVYPVDLLPSSTKSWSIQMPRVT